MFKKMLAFAGLAISFVIGLYCMVSSFSAFTNVAFGVAAEINVGSDVAYAIGYMLVGFILLVASLAGIVLSIIFLIKNKEPKFPIIPIIVLGCAAVLFIAYDIMVIVNNAETVAAMADHMGNGSKYDSYYGMTIVTCLLRIFTELFITLVVAACGVLSLIPFKKKQAAPAQ